MNNIMCACGHENPEGTVLCGNCGRALTIEAKNQKLADMRYEGSARRSQTYNKTIIDKIWNFFSSVKIGISLIILILVAAAIGTILPQVLYVPATGSADIAAYYERVYGTFGTIYNKLGLSDLYGSWWFQTLIGMLGISLIVASLDRVIPLYKSLKKQRTTRHESFMKRQRLFAHGDNILGDETLTKSEEKLIELRYKVKREDGALLAEKGRFARWGPYVNHVGLIIFLFAVMLRALPGFYVDETMWLREGETRAIPEAPGYYLESKEFILETYDKDQTKEVFGDAIDRVGTIASNYQTDVVLFKNPEGSLPGETDNLEEVKKGSIQVNKPLKFEGFAVYQMDFRLDELRTMHFNLVNKSSGESLGDLSVDLVDPKTKYDLGNGTTVELRGYYPDFSGFENGEPQTKSPVPNNPAFLVEMTTPETPEGETSFVAIKQTVEPLGDNEYKLEFQNVDTRDISGLTIRKDKTLWILALGGLIFMIGVAQGSYFNHRRIWILESKDGHLFVAAHTNKNWFGVKKELDQVTEVAQLPQYIDQQDIEAQELKKDGEKSS
ncbi:cytochrome c biogenesis protein ResB [Paenisporosarcina antarctica]|uniref:Cytochrome C biogenesis protein n=1 Tax=Paenisporosarcina antarctica TaxID=417367 RepID=A0A4P6ZXL7_9BACL|nr:cytochrome c biogenesis protein ResB [Paenisporosarcina antarctica]QBP41370.1 cytochrome C biogenesis protein [Paenisporosarcina antarctica]